MASLNAVGRVNADWLNMRATPDGEVLTVLKDGTQLAVTGRSGNWLQVQHQGQQGYVASRFVSLSPVDDAASIALPQGEVTASRLNLRNRPGGGIVGTLTQGTRVTVISEADGWLEVQTSEGGGYVSSRYINLSDEQPESPPATPVEANSPQTAVSFDGDWAVGPGGQRFGKKFRKGIFSYGDTRIGDFITQNRDAISSVSPSQLRLLEGVSKNEGKLEAINTWDNAFLSFGIFQWTAGVGSETGELPALFDRLQRRFPETFERYFGQYGLTTASVKEVAGQPARGYFKLNGQLLDSSSAKEALRTLIWPYRCKLAGMDDEVRLVQLEHAMARIDCFLRVDNRRIRGHYIGDYVTSEYGVAQLLDQHVNRPAHLMKTLSKAVDSLAGQLDIDNPAGWGDQEEQQLLEAYLAFRSQTNMTDGTERAARIQQQLQNGVLSDRRGSYQA